MAQIVIVDAVGHFRPERRLRHMRVDIDDEIVAADCARSCDACASTSRVSVWLVILASSRTPGYTVKPLSSPRVVVMGVP